MEFYADLSRYYGDIFPLTEEKVRLVKRYVPGGSRVLDVGCSTGDLVLTLAKDGYRTCGVDLSTEMIERARQQAKERELNAEFQVGDMRKLKELYSTEFGGVVCFGNTIVHLTVLQDLRDFFAQIYDLVQPTGTFMFQIVNYDKILGNGIKELPLIKNDDKKLTFHRMYDYDKEANLIHFKTLLEVEGQEPITHSAPLYPLTSDEIRVMLGAAGFADPRFYGNFAEGAYMQNESPALVVVARKG